MLRRTAAVIVVAAAAAASGDGGEPTPAATPAPAAPVAKTAEQRIQWYQDCWALFNARKWDVFQNCYAEDATSEQIDSTMPAARGRGAIMAAAQESTKAWPDVSGDLKLVLGHGPHAVSVALWHGTHTGPLSGPDGKAIPATNKPFGFLMAHTVEMDAAGNHATRDAAYIEEGTLMAQLGLARMAARPVMASMPSAPTVVVAKNDAAEAANVAALQAQIEAFNAHDAAKAQSYLADLYMSREVARPADMNKKEAMASTAERFNGFADVKLTTSSVWGAGDYVVATGTFDGTNTGPVPSVGVKKPTGKKVATRFIQIARFENGKIVDDWLFYNGAAFAAQLGLM